MAAVRGVLIYGLFNSILITLGQWKGNNDNLCTMILRSLERFEPPAGIKLGIARSAGQRLTRCATGAPLSGEITCKRHGW